MEGNRTAQEKERGMPPRKFLFCIPATKYRVSCCWGLFALRTAICAFAALDVLVGSINAVSLVMLWYSARDDVSRESTVLMIIDATLVCPALVGIYGAWTTDARKVSFYYYGKIGQLLGRPIFDLIYEKHHCEVKAHVCDYVTWLCYALVILGTLVIYVYQAYLCYSYVGLVERGEIVLANRGKKAVQALERYKQQQAAAIELRVAGENSPVGRAPKADDNS